MRQPGVARGHERRHEIDLVVERDQRELVGGLEPAQQERRALLGGLELGPGHGPGPVDDQGQVQGRPRRVGRGGRSDELQHGVHLVLGLDCEELMLQTNGCLHEGEPPFC